MDQLYLYSHQRSYFGSQCQSHMRTGPTAMIGMDARPSPRKKTYAGKEHEHAAKVGDPEVPSPMEYRAASAFGTQALSQRTNPPVSRVGTEKRFRVSEPEPGADHRCGPGQYPVIKCNMSRLSTRSAMTPIGFSSCTRAKEAYLPVRSRLILRTHCNVFVKFQRFAVQTVMGCSARAQLVKPARWEPSGILCCHCLKRNTAHWVHGDFAPFAWLQGAENTHLKGKCCSDHAYDPQATVGPAANRNLSSAPAVGFTKGLRDPAADSAVQSLLAVPGPGEYGTSEQYNKGIRCSLTRMMTRADLPVQ